MFVHCASNFVVSQKKSTSANVSESLQALDRADTIRTVHEGADFPGTKVHIVEWAICA